MNTTADGPPLRGQFKLFFFCIILLMSAHACGTRLGTTCSQRARCFRQHHYVTFVFTCQLNVTRDSLRIYSLGREHQPAKWKYS